MAGSPSLPVWSPLWQARERTHRPQWNSVFRAGNSGCFQGAIEGVFRGVINGFQGVQGEIGGVFRGQ